MADLLAAWLLYPLALGVVCLGLALLVERAAGWELPGLLLVPVGLTALLAYARVATVSRHTAPLALALLLVLAAGGLFLGRARLRALRPDPFITLAAVAVFLIFGAPVIGSGTPTFAGYLALPDTSHQLSLAWMLPRHGLYWQALAPGSLRLSMASYVQTHYPIAGQAALGVTAPLGVLDLAWLYQPFLSFLGVVSALSLGAIAAPLLRRGWQVAIAVFVAGQPALVVAFALQGSIKELAALAAIVTLVAALAVAVEPARPARSLLVVAIAAAAALGSLGPAALPYLVVPGIVVAGVWGWRLARRRERADAIWLGLGGLVAVVIALPVLSNIGAAITTSRDVLVNNAELGNLAAPLKAVQLLGIWLVGDYRYEPIHHLSAQHDMQIAVAVAIAIGVVWSILRRAWAPVLLAATLGLPALVLLPRGSPYADAKVYVILSVLAPLFAVLGAASLWRPRLRILSVLLLAPLVAGVTWTNALAYHDVSLAPYHRYAELLDINARIAGRGPALFLEYDEFGKYFLRDAPGYSEPEQPTPYRTAPYHPNALQDRGRRPSEKSPTNIDDLTLDYLESVPYIVMRRSPQSSRPPANFRLALRGRFYELWARRPVPDVVAHKPLGPDVLAAAAPVSRRVARAWAADARRLRGRIAYVTRTPVKPVLPARLKLAPMWVGFPLFPAARVPAGPGSFQTTITVPRTASYRVWMEGSFARRMTVLLDGRVVGRTTQTLNNPGAYDAFPARTLTRGRHRLLVRQGAGDLHPGSGGYLSSLRHVGPVFVSPVADEAQRVRLLDPDDWRRLVGVDADWLEIVR
jgi:hypothetical protein